MSTLASPITYGTAAVAVAADATAHIHDIPWMAIIMGTVAVTSMVVNWYYKRKEYNLKLNQTQYYRRRK